MKVTKRSCDVTPRSKYQKSKGHPLPPCASNLVQFRLLFTKLRHFEKNGTRNFSLIGRHLESVSRTIPVFKHTLAPSEKWPTQEISVRFGPFLSSYRVNIARCNLCARAVYVCFILRYSFNFGLNRASVSNCLSCALRNSFFASERLHVFLFR